MRWGSNTVSNMKILLRPLSTWRSPTNVTEVPGDWNDQSTDLWVPSNHIIHWLCLARITSAMIKTNTGERGGEKDSERHKESTGRLEGGGGQTDKEWVRQADILLHVSPPNESANNMYNNNIQYKVQFRLYLSWLYLFVCSGLSHVRPGCMISAIRDFGCEVLLTSCNVCTYILFKRPLRAQTQRRGGEQSLHVCDSVRSGQILTSASGNSMKAKWFV